MTGLDRRTTPGSDATPSAYSTSITSWFGAVPALGDGNCTLNTTVRPFFGGVIEFGLGRHLSAFTGLQYYLSNANNRVSMQTAEQIADDNDSRRPVTTSFWDSPIRAVIRAGVTYKF